MRILNASHFTVLLKTKGSLISIFFDSYRMSLIIERNNDVVFKVCCNELHRLGLFFPVSGADVHC